MIDIQRAVTVVYSHWESHVPASELRTTCIERALHLIGEYSSEVQPEDYRLSVEQAVDSHLARAAAMNGELPPHERRLIAVLLNMASDEFGNHGCNDFDLSAIVTPEQGKALMRAYHEWNGDPEEHQDDEYSGYEYDYAMMGFMAHRIYPEGEEKEGETRR
jgi:hypothetical protein